jgi:hypothetical protein
MNQLDLLEFNMNNNLEMLTAREQMMEDIICIMESNYGESDDTDRVINLLCDQLCVNFPTKRL